MARLRYKIYIRVTKYKGQNKQDNPTYDTYGSCMLTVPGDLMTYDRLVKTICDAIGAKVPKDIEEKAKQIEERVAEADPTLRRIARLNEVLKRGGSPYGKR